jgi:hypothetical protein
VYYFNMHCN